MKKFSWYAQWSLALLITGCVLCAGSGPTLGAQPARTMPVVTGPMKRQTPPERTQADSAVQPGFMSREHRSGREKASAARKAGGPMQGFSASPFSRERTGSSAPGADGPQQRKVIYGPGGRDHRDTPALTEDTPLSIVTTRKKSAENRLIPARTPFSGGEHTLPHMDNEAAPEVSMRYRLGQNATTRLTVNPQDETSPLYRPAEHEKGVNAAGVYMDVDISPDVQIQVGGEYCDVEARHAPSGSSQGAAVGVKWSF